MKEDKSNGNILIIDDEKDINTSLKSILENENYTVYVSGDGREGLDYIQRIDLDLVFLDLWLPNIDGLEILSDISNIKKDLKIIMMSGHAGVETIVRATKMGASDFIEKPFTASKILSLCKIYIPNKSDENISNKTPDIKQNTLPLTSINNIKNTINQKTIENSVVISGHALMSGRSTAMQLLPAPPNHGIIFVDMAKGTRIKLSPDNIQSSSNNSHANSTVLASEDSIIRTTEHFLATIHMYGINNLIVKCDEEVPNIDGSSLDFCSIIEYAGIKEQNAKIRALVIEDEIIYGDINNKDETSVKISPYDGLYISLNIDFPSPIGKQSYTYIFETPEQFKNEIGCARSFNTLESIQLAQLHGIVGAGFMDSHIIIDKDKIINTELRFEDEFVRHKILDIIGDLYILGIPFRGKIEANKTSHRFNHDIVIDIAKKYNYY